MMWSDAGTWSKKQIAVIMNTGVASDENDRRGRDRRRPGRERHEYPCDHVISSMPISPTDGAMERGG